MVRSIQVMEPKTSNLQLDRLVMIETPYIDQTSLDPINKLHKIVRASNSKRKTSWASVDEAMRWMTSRPPWKTFHPDVLRIISVRIPFFPRLRCPSIS